ncbi:MAG: DUF1330 domain-containing protein [Reichenbachiella sp.]|uniref:DUF1330 domain-containing protein n=1 Tax=Reichenbachiella sp. TaxID=2184521 RepID=UPI003262DBD7
MGKIILIIIASINPAEKEAAENYIKQVTAMQEAAGAVALYRFPISENFIGDMEVDVAAAIEFPSQEAFDSVFESEEYKLLIPFRDKGFSVLNAFISKQ